ncbi:LTA synthase family protein [Geothrix sp. 21YS21S-2]|uniref:LTA synthase family protein n=1 Tax=Geothrix sp. 21YS21S-2 TaxID=3068893 RepID=UPI0027B8F847|nr:LTA synthase family protein [Geothrix sp. 21YS21S-2]
MHSAPSAPPTLLQTAGSRLRPALLLAGLYLGLGLASRLALWACFGREAGVGLSALLWILPAGGAADAVQTLYFLLPLVLYLGLKPGPASGRNGLPHLATFLCVLGWLVLAGCEYFFFEEFNARFNLVSVNYLMYPTEVAGDIWTEYPVVKLILASALIGGLAAWWFRAAWASALAAPVDFRARSRVLAVYALLLAAAILWVPANLLGRSHNRVANELAANGPSSFFRALRTSEIDYHAYYATRPPAENLAQLKAQLAPGGGTFTRLAEGRLDRQFPARPGGLGRLNVVLISSESFGAEFSRLYGSERDWTPQFDQFAKKGLWFRHVYATGTRTVRGLEAITNSLPPVPTEAILRRPGHGSMATLGSVLRGLGYRSTFMYGGYGYFDNMNDFFSSNGYEVLDRTNLKTTPRFENIWGVSDEDLFDMALAHADTLATAKAPFFLHIMNTSNHKPFTFRPGLEAIGVKASKGGRESGVRYADYAQGQFLRQAERHAWFRDTLFIVIADHGARVYGRQEIPLRTYEIPLMLYSPAHLAPGRSDGLMSQMDLAPTLMGLLGLPYTAPWFGQDVLHTPEAGRVMLFNHNDQVALMKDGVVTTLGLHGGKVSKSYDPASDAYRPLPAGVNLDALAIAYYQTAYELFTARKLD